MERFESCDKINARSIVQSIHPLTGDSIAGDSFPGGRGQNVNKVSTAVHLFFDIRVSSLPEVYKQRLLSKKDRRISPAGIVIIKSQEARTRKTNGVKASAR
jgi:protein subunit release factor B